MKPFLLAINGYRFYIFPRKKEVICLEKKIPISSAVFLINQTLYACGGIQKTRSASLLWVDYSGQLTRLNSMSLGRSSASLSGLSSWLIVLGGFNQDDNLSCCEQYQVASNKWGGLSCLNISRQWPGSILLKSMRAFCFCGNLGFGAILNWVETLQIESEAEWRLLPLEIKIAKTYHLAAASFHNKVLVFGGSNIASFNTLILSEEGDLLEDRSSDALIPGYMGEGSYCVHWGILYSIGQNFEQGKWKWSMRAFDGVKWGLQWCTAIKWLIDQIYYSLVRIY